MASLVQKLLDVPLAETFYFVLESYRRVTNPLREILTFIPGAILFKIDLPEWYTDAYIVSTVGIGAVLRGHTFKPSDGTPEQEAIFRYIFMCVFCPIMALTLLGVIIVVGAPLVIFSILPYSHDERMRIIREDPDEILPSLWAIGGLSGVIVFFMLNAFSIS